MLDDTFSTLFGGGFANKRVFITGHTGFKGAWLAHWLIELGAKVHGFALEEPGAPATYTGLGLQDRMEAETIGDVRDHAALATAMAQADPEVVFHLAAQPIVRQAYRDPLETIQTNILGTTHLLETLRKRQLPCAMIVVTTDKCYDPRHTSTGYSEADPLGGNDIYSASKSASEILVNAYRNSYFPPQAFARHQVALATARAGNVLGGGDYASERIVPDCVRALVACKPIALRNPLFTRPWQHVLDSLAGYLTLANALLSREPAQYCRAWNFGPSPGAKINVEQLVQALLKAWGSGSYEVERKPGQVEESQALHLNIALAERELGWKPAWDLDATIGRTVRWYKEFENKGRTMGAMLELSRRDLMEYASQANKAGSKGFVRA